MSSRLLSWYADEPVGWSADGGDSEADGMRTGRNDDDDDDAG